MSTLTKQWTFANGVNSDATKVNQNFDDIIAFINSNAIQKDASLAFVNVPSGPAADPTTDNQFTRKKYVDDNLLLRPKLHAATTSIDGTAVPANTQLLMIPGAHVGTVVAGTPNNFTVTLPGGGFPTKLHSVTFSLGDGVNAPTSVPWSQSHTKTTFVVALPGSPATGPVRINYIAYGW